MSGRDAWKPSATLETLRLRAEIIASIRTFFARREVLEVETPALSAAGSTDPNLEPVMARVRALGAGRHYLMTSPEYSMKRLLAGGSGDVYQVCRVFRDGELGRWHQPEFTLLEWYRVGWNEVELMAEVDELLRTVLAAHRPRASTVRLSYREAFHRYLNIDPAAEAVALGHRLRDGNVSVPDDVDRDGLLDLAMGALIAPRFDPQDITFIHDYPAAQAALARIKPPSGEVAARFEAFSGGLELANGYHELTDAGEQRQRFEDEQRKRRAAGRSVPPLDESLLAALDHGLPDCAGVAVGVDRLVAIAADLDNVADTMSFAH